MQRRTFLKSLMGSVAAIVIPTAAAKAITPKVSRGGIVSAMRGPSEPSKSFASDNNTGFYFPDADTIAFTVGDPQLAKDGKKWRDKHTELFTHDPIFVKDSIRCGDFGFKSIKV